MMQDDAKERWREVVRAQIGASTADAAARVDNQLSIAQEAMKALLLANGGAMVALFTFVGNVLARSPAVNFDFHHLRWAFGLFVAGFVTDLTAYVMAFLSQDRFFSQSAHEVSRLQRTLLADEPVSDQTAELRSFRVGMVFYGLGLVLAVASVALFAIGCRFALAGVLV